MESETEKALQLIDGLIEEGSTPAAEYLLTVFSDYLIKHTENRLNELRFPEEPPQEEKAGEQAEDGSKGAKIEEEQP